MSSVLVLTLLLLPPSLSQHPHTCLPCGSHTRGSDLPTKLAFLCGFLTLPKRACGAGEGRRVGGGGYLVYDLLCLKGQRKGDPSVLTTPNLPAEFVSTASPPESSALPPQLSSPGACPPVLLPCGGSRAGFHGTICCLRRPLWVLVLQRLSSCGLLTVNF